MYVFSKMWPLKIVHIQISSHLPVQQKKSGWHYICIVGWLVGRLQHWPYTDNTLAMKMLKSLKLKCNQTWIVKSRTV